MVRSQAARRVRAVSLICVGDAVLRSSSNLSVTYGLMGSGAQPQGDGGEQHANLDELVKFAPGAEG